MALRCFVAMAFGHDDTDKVYDSLIVPTLRRKDITPVRVDHVEHNEDINNKIISLLQSCDLTIADLTYARPSVYFEAGFAQRATKVIYTSRADHFRPKADDEFGNLHVHFDLQMKNIVSWQNPSDQKFIRKLSTRISHVVAPLMRQHEVDSTAKRDADRFAALSQHERTSRILRVSTTQLQDRGYRGRSAAEHCLAEGYYFSPSGYRDKISFQYDYKATNRVREMRPGWIGTKLINGILHSALLHVTDSLTKRVVDDLSGVLHYPSYNINQMSEGGVPRKLVEHFFVCSMQRVSRSRIVSVLRAFRFDQKNDEFLCSTKGTLPKVELRSDVEVFPLGGSADKDKEGYRFVVRAPKKATSEDQEEEYETHSLREINELPDAFGTAVLKVRRVRAVPRSIRFRILDRISSEREFRERFLVSLADV